MLLPAGLLGNIQLVGKKRAQAFKDLTSETLEAMPAVLVLYEQLE